MKHGLHEGDMPDAVAMKRKLQSFDFTEFPRLNSAMLRKLDNVIDVDIQQVGGKIGGLD